LKKHTRVYLDFFDYGEQDYIPCEIPGCNKAANDVHHIEARGLGGDPTGAKDVIENLMGVCRNHHILYGDVPQYKAWLKHVHKEFMEKSNH